MAMISLVLGLALLFVTLGAACVVAVNLIVAVTGFRERQFRKALANLVNDREILDAIYEHPLLTPFRLGGTSLSTLPPRYFAVVFFEELQSGAKEPPCNAFAPFDGTFPQLVPGATAAIQRLLPSLPPAPAPDIDSYGHRIETWYENVMDVARDRLREHIRRMLFVLALTLSILVDADALNVATRLWQDEALRTVLVAWVQQRSPSNPVESFDQIPSQTAAVFSFPLGWTRDDIIGWPAHIPGWIITSLVTASIASILFEVGERRRRS